MTINQYLQERNGPPIYFGKYCITFILYQALPLMLYKILIHFILIITLPSHCTDEERRGELGISRAASGSGDWTCIQGVWHQS